MTRLAALRRSAFALCAGVALPAAALALASRSPSPLALLNESPSVPKGLYVRSLDQDLRPGRFVTLEQPATARPYLAGLGVPLDLRLLKRVAATGGEVVCASGGRLRAPRADVAVPDRDRRGVALTPWRGCRALAADEILLLGDSPASFDGRYFGPVRRTAVEGVYAEVLQW
jgi:type IV secretory pathway protease TraF